MAAHTVKKTFSLPSYMADRLDAIAMHTGVAQSGIVFQAIAAYMHRFEQEGTVENWLEHRGLCSGVNREDKQSNKYN